MASISTRASVLAVLEESTEGTPVAPSATGDYVALQDDFSMAPEFETLENAELRNSIGASKPILGLENPTVSFSHYLRHSGVEGTAPEFNLLLKAAFGAEDVEGTEYDIAATGTTSVLNVGGGEGANFRRGQALLIKDGTNGYAIRPVHSIATDALTLGFNLTTAPATGVNLGKAVTYYPTNSAHPSLSLWHYLGNGGAVQLMSGGRVVSTDITIEAGQLINASYSLEGTAFYFDPIVLTSSNNKLDFNDGGGEENATIAAGVYKDPHQLAEAIQTAMNTLSSGFTVTYSDTTGKFTLVKASGTFSLLWNTGANTAQTIGTKLGFLVAADDSGVLTYTSDNAQTLSSPQTATFDSADPLAAKDNVVFIGDNDDNVCFGPSSVSISMGTPKTDILSVCEVSGKAGSIINERTIEIEVTALLNQYDVDKWRRFRAGSDTRFMYNFGTKSGGNWVAGKCGCIYCPTAVISAFEITDEDGLATLNMTLTAYVDSSGNGEFYISFV